MISWPPKHTKPTPNDQQICDVISILKTESGQHTQGNHGEEWADCDCYNFTKITTEHFPFSFYRVAFFLLLSSIVSLFYIITTKTAIYYTPLNKQQSNRINKSVFIHLCRNRGFLT